MQNHVCIIGLLVTLLPGECAVADNQEQLHSQVFERLLTHLETWPKRWNQLPAPMVKPSGKTIESVLDNAKVAEHDTALWLISRLAQAAPEERRKVLDAEREARAFNEVDLWVPFALADDEKVKSVEEAAFTIDAYFDLATYLGRKDALLAAASMSMELLRRRMSIQRVLSAANPWANLPIASHERHAGALVGWDYAVLLFLAGHNQQAAKAYQAAREHFVAVGDQLGQGNTLLGEADVLFRLGDNEGSLGAYRAAHGYFVAVGSQFGPGNALYGEASVLFRLGDNESALGAYRAAHGHFVAVGDQLGQGNTLLGEANVLFRLGDNEGALGAYRTAQGHFVAVGDQLGQGNAMGGEAGILFRQGDHQGALGTYRTARGYFVAAGYRNGQGYTWNGEADVLLYLGDHQRALGAYRVAREHFVAVGDRSGQGKTLVGEAGVLLRLGDNQGALGAYREAHGHFVAVGNRDGQGNALVGEAGVLLRLGDNQGALGAYREAHGHFVAVGNRDGRGNALVGEAGFLFQLGDNQGALSAYRAAHGHFVAVGARLGQGNSWNGEADVLFRLGDNEGALRAYRAARGHFVAVGAQLGRATTWNREAGVLFQLGDNEGALGAYRVAHEHFAAVGAQFGQGNALVGEADILFQQGDNQGALAAYRAAHGHFVAGGSQRCQCSALTGEANVLFLQGDNHGALASAMNSAHFAERAESISTEYCARMVATRALAALGRDNDASAEALRALYLLKRLRARGSSDRDRTVMADMSGPHDFLVPHLSKTPAGQSRALELAEDAHAPVLLDLLEAETTGQTWTKGRHTLQQERLRIHKERARLQAELDRTLDPSARYRLKTQRDALDRELGLVELATLDTLKDHTSPRLSARERHMLIRDVGPIVLYYVAPEETLAFVLPAGGQPLRVVRIAASRDELHREVQDLRHGLGNPLWQERSNQRARALFDKLLGSVTDQLAGTSRLTIIPHGPLHQLPFEALIAPSGDNGKRVFEHWDITVAPSLSVLHRVREQETARRRKSKAAPFIALAAGQGLHFPDREVQDIAAIFGRDQATFRQGKRHLRHLSEQAARARFSGRSAAMPTPTFTAGSSRMI